MFKKVLCISLIILIFILTAGCADNTPKKSAPERPQQYSPKQPPKAEKSFSKDAAEAERHRKAMDNLNKMEIERNKKNAEYYNKMIKDNERHYNSQAQKELKSAEDNVKRGNYDNAKRDLSHAKDSEKNADIWRK